jgi:hypothetical protein
MATQITGLVQRVKIQDTSGGHYACVYVGPTLANAHVVIVQPNDIDNNHPGFANSMVSTFVAAMLALRQVTVVHDSPTVLSVQIDAA